MAAATHASGKARRTVMSPSRSGSRAVVLGFATRTAATTRAGTQTLGAGLVLFTLLGLRSARPIYMTAIATIAIGRALAALGTGAMFRAADLLAGI